MGLRDWIPRRLRPGPGPGQTQVHVDDPVIGPVRQQAPFPRVAKTSSAAPRGAPRRESSSR